MSSRIDFLKPDLLNNQSISAWFTFRNHLNVNQTHDIPGLNLGTNTSEPPEIIEGNITYLLNELGLDDHRLAYAKQVHRTNIESVDEGGEYPDTDGLLTTSENLVLAIQVADCAAILLGDNVNRVVGAVHAGWRGASSNICVKMIDKMKELGAESKHIKAFISPCLSLENFEVGMEVAKQFPSSYVDYTTYQKPHVDLKAFLKDQLRDMGIEDENIEVNRECTIENKNLYSYRRQKEKSGRMMALIKLNQVG